MASYSAEEKQVFTENARPVVHMRRQVELKRFGLIFGAGLSRSFGLPTWQQLVQVIAAEPAVNGSALLTKFGNSKSLPYQTELLLQHYKRSRSTALGTALPGSKDFEYQIIAEWLRIVAKHLYANAPTDFDKALSVHPYIGQFLPLIRQTGLTVTYNFDNYLERALSATRPSGPDTLSLGYETVTNPFAQFRRQNSVIFHPNGYYPQAIMEVPVDRFIFSEASYAEQFLGVLSGNQTALTNHLAKTTCLLIGLSLDDEMLRNLLVLSANINPGNYHYYVHFLKKGETLTIDEKEAIRRTNFCVYNLVTLFLHEEEVAALGGLLDSQLRPTNQLCDLAELVKKPACYCFYLTGPMGVGKSTTVNQYRNLAVIDEWMEERPPVLCKDWKTLTPAEKVEADKWIIEQFKLKNENLRHAREGIFMVDRPPLDPLAFTPKAEQQTKAKSILAALCEATNWPVKEGAVLLLSGDSREMAARIKATGRNDYTPDSLDNMGAALNAIYNAPGVVPVDTHGLSISEVTRKVGQIIHLDDYTPFETGARLKEFESGAVSVDTK